MVKLTVEDLCELHSRPANIRNMTVVAHVDHGKSTLTDSLVFAAGIIQKSDTGVRRFTSIRKDEQDRGITIKSTGISLHYEMPEELMSCSDSSPSSSTTTPSNRYLINLIDSPGHVDFSSEVSAALRVTDGALVVVDCVEGIGVQTETVIRQALTERIKPVLCANKLDRMIVHTDPEEFYMRIVKCIESTNALIETYQERDIFDWKVDPIAGSVVFASGFQGWAFSLDDFAKMYASKFNVTVSKMKERLWGENFYDNKTKCWSTSQYEDGRQLERGFSRFVLTPLKLVTQLCESHVIGSNEEKFEDTLRKIGVKLSEEDRKLDGKALLKSVMMSWLPAGNALLSLICNHLPSPIVAQKYRAEILYTGPMDDATCESMRKCDPNGPLVMFVSKMVPDQSASKKGPASRFFAFGRVFSGTITSSQTVRVFHSEDSSINDEQPVTGGSRRKVPTCSVQRVCVQMGGKFVPVPSVPAGNTVALVGIDSVLTKTGTLTVDPSSFPLREIHYAVSPVVRVAISTKKAVDLPKLITGLQRLSKSDSIVEVTTLPTGEHVIGCAGELHMEICLKDLQTLFVDDCELVFSDPVVSYCESVSAPSTKSCLAKSKNKHNRIYSTAEPLSEALIADILSSQFNSANYSTSQHARVLHDRYGWDLNDAKKIWCFGAAPHVTNVLVDQTKSVMYLNEVRDSITAGFNAMCRRGVLCDEAIRGVRFNLTDGAEFHADAAHRGAGAIVPTATRSFQAAQLCAAPILLEPIYLARIRTAVDQMGGVYSLLGTRRGVFLEESDQRAGWTMIKAYLPVSESFELTGALRSRTGGKAFPDLSFSHYAAVPGLPLNSGSLASKVLVDIRSRKGMKLELPKLEDYVDRL